MEVFNVEDVTANDVIQKNIAKKKKETSVTIVITDFNLAS